jgi:hypothetical protein
MLSGRIRIVQRDLLQCDQKLKGNWNSVAQLSGTPGSMPWNGAKHA